MATPRGRRPLPHVLVIVGTFLGILLLAAACGSSSDSDGSGDGGGATATTEEGLEPEDGGSLVYGVESESDGWNPIRSTWALSGQLIAQTVFDSLAAYNIDGVAEPYLAEAIDPNEDYTLWTIRMRDGVRFHDGDLLTATAVEIILGAHLNSALTAPAFEPIESIEVIDDLTLEVTMNTPWVAFPTVLTGQTGVVPHPEMILGSVVDVPVGTGPFVFEEWVPDDKFVAVKNAEYWREGLPHLDQIEFRPMHDALTRVDALRAGDVDVIHAGAETELSRLESQIDAGDVRVWTDTGENEESSVMVNQTRPPFDDVRAREALAYATDQANYIEVVNGGGGTIAVGPFTETNPFHVETDYPTYDLDRAKELVQELKDEGKSVSFTLWNTPNAFDRNQSAFLQEMYQEAGFEVDTQFEEFATFVLRAVGGDFEAMAWRQFSSPDPDGDSHWWRSGSTLNFSGLADDQIDEALEAGRTNDDPATREEAYADLQHRMAELVPFIWLDHVTWTIIAAEAVHDVPSGPLPNGDESLPFQAGVHRTAQIWRSQ